jgi:hypothetical protein
MQRLLVVAFLGAALLAGCLQDSSDSQPSVSTPQPTTATVPTAAPKLDAALLLSDLKSFASQFPERHDNVATHEGARQWILQQWADAGLTTYRQNFTSGIPQANMIGVKWGEDRDDWIIVGGHYDTTHWDCSADDSLPEPVNCAGHELSQGAYDDGSGTMMSVELGKLWANVTSHYTIAFVAYDGEERGLNGARAFVKAATEGPDGDNPLPWNFTIRGALDIDMFGITWPGTNAPTQILDNSNALHGVFQETRKAMGMPDDMYFCKDMFTLGSSDFQEYFDLGVPTVFFSSDFGKWTPPGAPASPPQSVYPDWHFIDTYDTMQAMAGGAPQLLAGFQTASGLAAAELHAMADTELPLDVHEPVTGPC